MPLSRKHNYLCVGIVLLSTVYAQTTGQIDAIASALGNKEFSRALELLSPVLRQSPGDARLRAMQGTAYAGIGKTEQALNSFQAALKIAPDYLPALQGAAQIEFEAGSAKGIPLLKRLLRARPDDAVGHGMLAVLEFQQGNCAAAIAHFEKAGALFNEKPDALHAYATCLVRLRQTEKAVTIEQRALDLNADDRHERQLLASLQMMAHQPQQALATLNPLQQNGIVDSQSLELASAAYEDLHDTEHAVDELRQAIVLDPQNVQLYVDFAALASSHQSFEVGINAVNDGIELHPKAAALYFARGVLHVQLGNYDKGQDDFETAYTLDPTQSLSAAALSLAAVQQNDLDRALDSVQKKLTSRPNDPILLYIRADVLTQKGAEPGSADFQTAMRSAKKAVALNPSLGPARAVLSKLYLQAGQFSEAAAQCRKALEIDPKDQTSLYRLIQALRKSDKKNEIPGLLKRLALLRQEATKQEREHYRYKLVDESAQIKR